MNVRAYLFRGTNWNVAGSKFSNEAGAMGSLFVVEPRHFAQLGQLEPIWTFIGLSNFSLELPCCPDSPELPTQA